MTEHINNESWWLFQLWANFRIRWFQKSESIYSCYSFFHFIIESLPFTCTVMKIPFYMWCTELSMPRWLKCACPSLTIIKADKPQGHHNCTPVPVVPIPWNLEIQDDRLTPLTNIIPKRPNSTMFQKAMFASWFMPLIRTKF